MKETKIQLGRPGGGKSILIEGDISTGKVLAIHDDLFDVAFGGHAKAIRRASHIRPTDDGKWEVDLSPIGIDDKAIFARRETAVIFEINVIQQNLTAYGEYLFSPWYKKIWLKLKGWFS